MLRVTIICLMCLSRAVGAAPDEFVYTVRIPAGNDHTSLVQTGFRVTKPPGLITALHGEADCSTISAYNEYGDSLNDLKVTQVDIDRDVALLTSAALARRDATGLSPATTVT